MSCYITGCGAALPTRIVTNTEVAAMLGVAPEWIETSSGIREPRWIEADTSTSDLAAAAVCEALIDARVNAAEIDYLIGGTLSPDYQVPGIAPLVQRKLDGCRNVPAVDLRVGCAAILYSLQLARGLVESGAARNVVCFCAEAQSKGLDFNPRSAELSMLFGDGAGAFVLSRAPGLMGEAREVVVSVEDVLIETDGSFAEDLIVRAPGTANGARWFDAEHFAASLHYGGRRGRNGILQAVRKLGDAAISILDRNGVSLEQVSVIIPHQAN